ncbi:MAG: carboxymuconolactone decarboxylase family protein [Desulfuromonadales bacterium]|nr:carboxymuconolactone decarboxylase family protein [Desulfuromonadales bacterium]
MPVIPYLPNDLQEPVDLVTAIRSRRGGELLNLDRMLLYSPAFAAGWNSFLGAVRNALSLPDKLRELAICSVAVLNAAEYEFIQHAPEFIKAGGREEQLTALRNLESTEFNRDSFSADELAVIDLSMEMTRRVSVTDKIMSSVKTALDTDQQLMELIGVIATYNMVSRYLVALGIEVEGDEAQNDSP